MRFLRIAATVALLFFVGATVGLLIAQEASPSKGEPVADGSTPVLQSASGGTEGDEAAGETAPVGVTASSEESPSQSDREGLESVDDVADAPIAETTPQCAVDAIYFHNTARCWTCKKIEETAEAVLRTEFPEEFASGRLTWSAINLERQPHYVVEYELVKPTLILVRRVGEDCVGWVALDETWNLIRNDRRFESYVSESTREYLEACP